MDSGDATRRNIGIAGAHGFTELDTVRSLVAQLPRDAFLHAGPADDVSQVVVDEARRLGMCHQRYIPVERKRGGAGINRAANQMIRNLRRFGGELVVFVAMDKHGAPGPPCSVTIDMAKRYGVPVTIVHGTRTA